MRKWVLPDQVEDLLAPTAIVIETTRRTLIDHLVGAGFDLVEPPLVEHLEALLTGTGHDLEAATFKLLDPLSGRMLGVRPDITPQIARIDATYFDDASARRYCYAGSVLRATAGLGESRVLTQVGAELFGEASVAGDIEIVTLMIEAARKVNAAPLLIDFGHIGLFKALTQHYRLPPQVVARLDAALAMKAASAIEAIDSLPGEARAVFVALTRLFGPVDSVLARAREALPTSPAVVYALDELAAVSSAATHLGASVSLDLADLPGLDYHTGIVFVAYLHRTPEVVARGGRYDGVGEAFAGSGRAAGAETDLRPATGFSFVDLRALAALTHSV